MGHPRVVPQGPRRAGSILLAVQDEGLEQGGAGAPQHLTCQM